MRGCITCGAPLSRHSQAADRCNACRAVMLELRCRMSELVRKVRAARGAYNRRPPELSERSLRRGLVLMTVGELSARGGGGIPVAQVKEPLPALSKTMPDRELGELAEGGLIEVADGLIAAVDPAGLESETRAWRLKLGRRVGGIAGEARAG